MCHHHAVAYAGSGQLFPGLHPGAHVHYELEETVTVIHHYRLVIDIY